MVECTLDNTADPLVRSLAQRIVETQPAENRPCQRCWTPGVGPL
jgi:uncharacterized protein (DUF305 family)